MPHPISALGAAHTAVSLVTFAAGLVSYVRYKTIERHTGAGRLYLLGMLVSVLTSFGLSSTGGFNAGHALGILALLATFGGLVVPALDFLGRARLYLSALAFAFSFFLLLVPGINETLTRLPVGRPLASGPDSPLVRVSLAVWLGIFVIGALVQCLWLRSTRSRTAVPVDAP
ncbi:hypothetical protein AB870_17900 [Pandoraea faecigallinarum]|uniref:DUF2306 domain-containing protein n=1 Tax=Pandoraea faecigallinarum TaxID=656179 RepID=A0A0H3X1V5_9BURK|nr:hypothetical protein [Pandoraea faecigallinarum]AKM32968.1 hypothetical protein AB870_17900 [Pandoraea faecigallinarum]